MRQQFKPSGINLDISGHELEPNLYSAGNNFQFRNSVAMRSGGTEQVYGTPGQAPLYLINAVDSTTNYWVYGAATSIRVTDNAGSHTDLTGATTPAITTAQNVYTGGILNGIPYINFQQDAPQWWDLNIGNNTQDLPGWNASEACGAMRAHKYHLIAMDMSYGNGQEDEIKWSSAAPAGAMPGSWTAEAGNEAGSNFLSDTRGPIIDGISFRGGFLVAKTHSTYLMQYIGGVLVYSFRLLFSGTGMLTRNCASEVQGKVVMLTDGDVIITDGQNIESIADRKVRRWLFSQIDQDNYQRSFLARDKRNNEIWICFPSSGSTYPDTALVWNWQQDHWGVRELGSAAHIASGIVDLDSATDDWDTDTESWDEDGEPWGDYIYSSVDEGMLIANFTATELQSVDTANTRDGTNIEAYLERTGMDMGEPDAAKLVRRVWPRCTLTNGQTVKIRVGASETAGGPITWSSEYDYTVGSDRNIMTFARGRYIAVRFRTTGVAALHLDGFDIEYELSGRYG
jgi:hypothetical protein